MNEANLTRFGPLTLRRDPATDKQHTASFRAIEGPARLRLRGRGVAPVGDGPRGDQKVELRIVAPPQIDDGLGSRNCLMSKPRTSASQPARKTAPNASGTTTTDARSDRRLTCAANGDDSCSWVSPV